MSCCFKFVFDINIRNITHICLFWVYRETFLLTILSFSLTFHNSVFCFHHEIKKKLTAKKKFSQLLFSHNCEFRSRNCKICQGNCLHGYCLIEFTSHNSIFYFHHERVDLSYNFDFSYNCEFVTIIFLSLIKNLFFIATASLHCISTRLFVSQFWSLICVIRT